MGSFGAAADTHLEALRNGMRLGLDQYVLRASSMPL
jgi:hypothetical protein